jgi:hypothetical protein
MAHYLVTARLRPELRAELRELLASGQIRNMNPFGPTLQRCLQEARLEIATDRAAWEELCYCATPLDDERAAVLDRFFEGLEVEVVPPGEGWRRIAHLPSLWAE